MFDKRGNNNYNKALVQNIGFSVIKTNNPCFRLMWYRNLMG